MKLYFNKDTRKFVKGQRSSIPLSDLVFTRRDLIQIELIVVENGRIIELENDATIIIGLKPSGDYDGNFVVLGNTYTKTGVGETSRYWINLDFSTSELGDLFSAEDQASVDLSFECEIINDGYRFSSESIETIVNNDFIQGIETELPAYSGVYPALILDYSPTSCISISGITSPSGWNVVLFQSGTNDGNPLYTPVSGTYPIVKYVAGDVSYWEINDDTNPSLWFCVSDASTPVGLFFEDNGDGEGTPSISTDGYPAKLGQTAFVVVNDVITEKWLCISESPITWEQQGLSTSDTPIDLNGGTELTIGRLHFEEFVGQQSHSRTLTFVGTPVDGDTISLILSCSQALVLTVPESRIIGSNLTLTTLSFSAGHRKALWTRIDSKWYVDAY